MAAGRITQTLNTLSGLPLGTVGNSATGEVVLKVSVREGGSAPPAATTFNSIVNVVTTGGTVPVGALSWSITNLTSTDLTVSGDTIPAGATVGGGGYGASSTLATAITYTLSTGSAIVVYDVAV